MFSYNIAANADNAAFKNTCAQIEAKVSGLKKDKLIVDVDGSLIQTYHTNGGEITVYNDYLVDAVYVDSEIDLAKVI